LYFARDQTPQPPHLTYFIHMLFNIIYIMRNYGTGYKSQKSNAGAPYELFQRFLGRSLFGQFDHPSRSSTSLQNDGQTVCIIPRCLSRNLPQMANRSQAQLGSSKVDGNHGRICSMDRLGKLGGSWRPVISARLHQAWFYSRGYFLDYLSSTVSPCLQAPCRGTRSPNSSSQAGQTSRASAEFVDQVDMVGVVLNSTSFLRPNHLGRYPRTVIRGAVKSLASPPHPVVRSGYLLQPRSAHAWIQKDLQKPEIVSLLPSQAPWIVSWRAFQRLWAFQKPHWQYRPLLHHCRAGLSNQKLLSEPQRLGRGHHKRKLVSNSVQIAREASYA